MRLFFRLGVALFFDLLFLLPHCRDPRIGFLQRRVRALRTATGFAKRLLRRLDRFAQTDADRIGGLGLGQVAARD